jgi:hypothetical protein
MSTRSGKGYFDIDEQEACKQFYEERKNRRYIQVITPTSTLRQPGFDLLPVVVFDLIHSGLSHYEYAQLLNCNKEIFHSVKRETLHYHLSCPSSWKSKIRGLLTQEQKLDYCKEMIENNVTDRSKQVEVTFHQVTMNTFEKYHGLLSGIFKVNLVRPLGSWKKTLEISSLLPLHGIYHVTLKCVKGFQSLEGLEESKIIEIDTAVNLIDVSAISNATKVSLKNCSQITEVKHLKNVPDLTIVNCIGIKDISEEGGFIHSSRDRFEYSAPKSLSTLLPLVQNTSKYISIETVVSAVQLGFECASFPLEVPTCSANFVNLTNYSYHHGYTNNTSEYPLLPAIFPNVNNLKLIGFNLSLWKSSSFLSFITIVELQNCIIPDFLSFQEVEHLKISNIQCDFIDYRIFKKLKTLYISQRIVIVANQNQRIDEELETLSSVSSLVSLSLNQCSISKLPILNQISSLEIVFCRNLQSLENISHQNLTFVAIRSCPVIMDFSPLNGLKNVYICGCPGFSDGLQVKSVQKLIISGCHRFCDTSTVGSIQDLTLHECSSVKELKGLTTVQKLTIYFTYTIKDISELVVTTTSSAILFKFSSKWNRKFFQQFKSQIKGNPLIEVDSHDDRLVIPFPSLFASKEIYY